MPIKQTWMGNQVNDIDKLLGTESVDEDILSISKSLITNVWDYEKGEYCGIALRDINVLKIAESEPTYVMKLGHWFEYLCTGQVNRDGSTPGPVLTSTKKPDAKSLKMVTQANRFKRLAEVEKLKIERTGTIMIHPMEGYQIKGVLDIFGSFPDVPQAIVDLKSSGLIGDQWKPYGWHPQTLNQRDHLSIQVVAYKYLAWKTMDIEDAPFYFIIHSTANDIDSVFWRVDLDNFAYAMEEFELLCQDVHDKLRSWLEFGFFPHPEVKRCEACPLRKDCLHAIDTPALQVINIDGIYRRK